MRLHTESSNESPLLSFQCRNKDNILCAFGGANQNFHLVILAIGCASDLICAILSVLPRIVPPILDPCLQDNDSLFNKNNSCKIQRLFLLTNNIDNECMQITPRWHDVEQDTQGFRRRRHLTLMSPNNW